jgi:hypothetical protein
VTVASQSFCEQSAEPGAGARNENHSLGIHDVRLPIVIPVKTV